MKWTILDGLNQMNHINLILYSPYHIALVNRKLEHTIWRIQYGPYW